VTASIWKRCSSPSNPSSVFAPAEEDGHDDVHLVDQISLEESADRGGTAAHVNVEVAGHATCQLECLGGRRVDDVEGRAGVPPLEPPSSSSGGRT